MRALEQALLRRDYNLAAHVLVYGMVKARAAVGRQESHGRKRTGTRGKS